MGDFNAKVGRRELSAMSSAVGLYGLGETSEAGEYLEDFCLEHELAPVCWPRRRYKQPVVDISSRRRTLSLWLLLA